MAERDGVEIPESWVREIFSSWDGPAGEIFDRAVDDVETAARIAAPVGVKDVWTKGHRFLIAPGYLKALTAKSVEHHHDSDGFILGLVSAPTLPYGPLATPRSRAGVTRNRGGKSVRPARNRFLEDAATTVFATTDFWAGLWPKRAATYA